MRPEIPPALEERIEKIYENAGYASGTELVRDAVRRWVSELETKYPERGDDDYPDLSYTVSSNTKLIKLELIPTEDSDLRIGDSGGQHQSVPTLYTESAMIKNETMKPALESITGVKYGGLTHSGEFSVKISRDTEADLDSIVDEVFRTIKNVIQNKENPVARVEEATAQYAEQIDDGS